jgi:RNA-directed DNA polymerase
MRLVITGFVHIAHNLYVMRTPRLPGKPQTAIEDFFRKETLSTELNGKTFHPSNTGFDTTKHYNKKAFAHSVVRPNAPKINFSRFAAILKMFVDIMNHCATKAGAP